MLHKLKNRKNEGFTIIEVLIVLAIAGLILLIVLLAVPALQRNSRNTSIKNEASGLTGAISSFEANSDGAKITSISATGLISGAANGVTEQAKLQGTTTVATIASAPNAVVTHGTLQVILGHSCGSTVTTTGPASSRANAIYYSVETTSAETAANNNKCVDS